MTQVPIAVTEGSLSQSTADGVLSLAAAAAAADGIAPLSEDALYTVEYGGAGVQHLCLTQPDGTVIGYAHLVPPEVGAPDDDRSGELLIHPAHRRQGLGSDLATELREHALQVALQDRERAELQASGRPRYELPMIPEGIDLASLYQLAATLREQGAA